MFSCEFCVRRAFYRTPADDCLWSFVPRRKILSWEPFYSSYPANVVFWNWNKQLLEYFQRFTRKILKIIFLIIAFMISFITPQFSNNCSNSTVKIRRQKNFRYLSCWPRAVICLLGYAINVSTKSVTLFIAFLEKLIEATEKLAMITCLMSHKS